MNKPRFAAVICALLFARAFALAADAQPGGKKFALLVGVNEYRHQNLARLRFSENDVTELGKLLTIGGYNVTLLRGGEATRSRIEGRLREILGTAQANDSVLVAFAGHGLQFPDLADGYFCPVDAKPFADETATLISLDRVYKDLERSYPRVKVLLVDACRNDGTRGRRGVDGDSAPRPPRGVAAFFSCAAGEISFEHEKYRHGVFFHFVLEGLRGQAQNKQGNVTFHTLVDYVSDRVACAVPELFHGGAKQSPNAKSDLQGPAPVLFSSRPVTGDQRSEAAEISNSLGMKLMRVSPGRFTMGSPASEEGRLTHECPQHEVEITQPFYMAAHEVTVGQFAAFVKATNYRTEAETDGQGGYGFNALTKTYEGRSSRFNWKKTSWAQTDRHPVVNVSWNDAVAFCKWLSQQENKVYELPTEAEWEYAGRAGSKTRYHSGNGDGDLQGAGNIADASFKTGIDHKQYAQSIFADWNDGYPYAAPVGQFQANAWGLHDMHGNVWEWCADWYEADYYSRSPTRDPRGADSGTFRILRGGSFFDIRECRSASRFGCRPDVRFANCGFRVICRE